jgi:sporulation protein YlmC with PRC-barrel domain
LTEREIIVGLHVLDHQIVDKDGRRCGNVDDLAIDAAAGNRAEVVALLVGPGYWRGRSRRLGALAGKIGGNKRVRVSWENVAKIDSAIHLSCTAKDAGLGGGDDRLRPWIERIPGARR